jgi:hypothetical protein
MMKPFARVENDPTVVAFAQKAQYSALSAFGQRGSI